MEAAWDPVGQTILAGVWKGAAEVAKVLGKYTFSFIQDQKSILHFTQYVNTNGLFYLKPIKELLSRSVTIAKITIHQRWDYVTCRFR